MLTSTQLQYRAAVYSTCPVRCTVWLRPSARQLSFPECNTLPATTTATPGDAIALDWLQLQLQLRNPSSERRGTTRRGGEPRAEATRVPILRRVIRFRFRLHLALKSTLHFTPLRKSTAAFRRPRNVIVCARRLWRPHPHRFIAA